MQLRSFFKEIEGKVISSNDIVNKINSGTKSVLNLNLYACYLALVDDDFYKSIKSADWVHLDGIGASVLFFLVTKVWVKPIGYKYWTNDFFTNLSSVRVCILGGTKKENECAIEELSKLYPSVSFAGRDGYGSYEELSLSISNEKFDYAFVGISMPSQEVFISKMLSSGHDDVLYFACGGWIKQIAGLEPPVPFIFRRLYLEWLYRSFIRRGHLKERVIWPLIKIASRF